MKVNKKIHALQYRRAERRQPRLSSLLRDPKRSCEQVSFAPVKEIIDPARLRAIYERHGLPVPENLR